MRYEMKSGKEYVSKVQASVWCRLVYGMPLQGVHIQMYKSTACSFRSGKKYSFLDILQVHGVQ